ncbi:MAG: phosphomannomutase/phosphoglucomutase [Armatimonadota bacterium]
MLDQTIFREADIRGHVSPTELNPDSVNLIAKAYGSFLQHQGIETVVLGYDSRLASEAFAAAFIDGLLYTGRDIINLGLALTPMVYWAQFHYESLGATMITGSHNPPDWSGFKLAKGYVYTLVTDEIRELKRMVLSEDFVTGKGRVRTPADMGEDFTELFTADLASRVEVARPFKVVCDAGNGTAGAFAPELLRRVGCEVEELFCDLDPTFPNHFPDPATVEARKLLAEHTLKTKADAGFCFDGDGDRLGVIDDAGNTLWLDRLGTLWADELLSKKPGATIVGDVKCSNILRDHINAKGGNFVFSRTGHPFIKRAMKENHADLGVEFSGHAFFGEGTNYFGYDDALFAGIKTLEALSHKDCKLSECIQGLPSTVGTPEIRIECPDDKKYGVADDVARRMKADGYQVETLDGARASFDYGWGLLRASSNMPMVQVRCESDTEEHLEQCKQVFREYLKAYDYVSAEWENE